MYIYIYIYSLTMSCLNAIVISGRIVILSERIVILFILVYNYANGEIVH